MRPWPKRKEEHLEAAVSRKVLAYKLGESLIRLATDAVRRARSGVQ